MENTLVINVTQEDIDLGSANCCMLCPVARASGRVLGHCAVSATAIRVFQTGKSYRLPAAVVSWIERLDERDFFDSGWEPKPFTFEVEE